MKKNSRITFILFSILFACVYAYLAFLVGNDGLRESDRLNMLQLQRQLPPFIDIPFSLLTLLGSTEVTLVIVVVLFILVLMKKNTIFLGIFLFFLLHIVELLGKIFIFNPPPPPILNRYSLDFHFPSSFIISTSYSFPSGHMARSTFIAVILLFFFMLRKTTRNKKIIATVLCICYIGSMFISRIYLGEHWFSDVAGGLLLGLTIAFLALSFY